MPILAKRPILAILTGFADSGRIGLCTVGRSDPDSAILAALGLGADSVRSTESAIPAILGQSTSFADSADSGRIEVWTRFDQNKPQGGIFQPLWGSFLQFPGFGGLVAIFIVLVDSVQISGQRLLIIGGQFDDPAARGDHGEVHRTVGIVGQAGHQE